MNHMIEMKIAKQQMGSTARESLDGFGLQSCDARREVKEMIKAYWKQEMKKAEELYQRLLQTKEYMEEGLDELAIRSAAIYLAEIIASQNERLGELAEIPGFIENCEMSEVDFWDFRLDLLFASARFEERAKGITSRTH